MDGNIFLASRFEKRAWMLNVVVELFSVLFSFEKIAGHHQFEIANTSVPSSLKNNNADQSSYLKGFSQTKEHLAKEHLVFHWFLMWSVQHTPDGGIALKLRAESK